MQHSPERYGSCHRHKGGGEGPSLPLFRVSVTSQADYYSFSPSPRQDIAYESQVVLGGVE